jgi:DNA polymerase-3 subunit gamma/tau
MFENIIGHAGTVALLREEIAGNRLPAAVLFHGPQYTGKTTTALELARAVTCEKGTAEWTCDCHACRQQRMLVHPYTLLLGAHYFLQEITVAAEAFKGHPSKGTRFLYLRAVRKLLRRFDEVLWQGQENRISQVASTVREVAETLEELDPRRPLPGAREIETLTARLSGQAKKLAAALPQDSVPVQTVRNVSFWAHMSGPRKVVIIDAADRLNDGARNALLKTLEEPPPEVIFVLLAGSRTAVMPTILSRVRQYEFAPRSVEEQCDVVRRVFRESELECGSLREYFLSNGFSGSESITSLAEAFIEAVVSPHTADGADRVAHVQQALQEIADVHVYRYFFEELSELLRRILANDVTTAGRPIAGTDTLAAWRDLVSDAAFRVESLNMNPTTVCESLYFSMRQVDAGVH